MKWSILPETTEERAVSPVIGVILMVAVTVILAAVVSMLVLDMGQEIEEVPQANFGFDYDAGDVLAQNGTLVITHEGGDKIAASDLSVKVGNNDTIDWDPLGLVASGDSFEITENGQGYDFDGKTVRVIWNYDGESAVLARYTVP